MKTTLVEGKLAVPPKKKRSRTSPVPLKEALQRLKTMIVLLERKVRTALELEASLETANDIVKSDLHGHQFYGAACYDTVKLGSSLYLALTLAKLFERPAARAKETLAKRYNRSDIASVPLMLRLLSQKRCSRRLAAAAGNWMPYRSSLDDANVGAAGRRLDAACARFREL